MHLEQRGGLPVVRVRSVPRHAPQPALARIADPLMDVRIDGSHALRPRLAIRQRSAQEDSPALDMRVMSDGPDEASRQIDARGNTGSPVHDGRDVCQVQQVTGFQIPHRRLQQHGVVVVVVISRGAHAREQGKQLLAAVDEVQLGRKRGRGGCARTGLRHPGDDAPSHEIDHGHTGGGESTVVGKSEREQAEVRVRQLRVAG